MSAAGDRLDARGERRIGLVGEPVVVLDVVDAALREARRQHREPPRRQALRLERRGGHRPRAGGDPPPQARETMARPAEAEGELARKRDVLEHHVLVQRGVAEQHVEELPGIVADGLAGERDADLELPVLPLGDLLDPADDAREHEFIVDRRQRHLDALLDRDRAGARLDRAGIAADTVDGLQAGAHESTRTRRTAPSRAPWPT